MDLEAELKLASDLAREAGDLVRRYFGSDLTVELKPDDDPVTRADREASDLILEGLRGAFPEDTFVSEEAPLPEVGADRVWFIDPIDGTRDFITGLEGFAVMIGLCVQTEPVLGVVYHPPEEALYRAARGWGATLSDASGERPLRCSVEGDLSRQRLVASRRRNPAFTEALRVALGTKDILRIGSVGVKASLIASGRRDVYVNPGRKSKAWDTCAPQVIVDQAGGRMTDLRGDPLRYDIGSVVNSEGIVATNGVVHEDVIRLVAELPPMA